MSQCETLLQALRNRLAVVADHDLRDRDPAGHLTALKQAASELDAVIAGLPAGTPPMLRHYLERQSYEKAIAWLVDPANTP